MDCLFCKIIQGEVPSDKVYEDDFIYAFNDINPAAPVHVLIIPKEHIASMDDVGEEHKDVIGHLFSVLPQIAKELELEDGYRVVNNCGEHGQQSVQHLHFHLLGGRQLQWPPG